MVYKLDESDKLCGVTYIDWSKKYSKIPKATCEMIQPKCSSGGGGSYDDAVELKCEDLKKLIHGEEKPKEEKEEPKEDKPKEDVTPKENEPSPLPKVDENPTEPTPEPPVADTPREDTPTEGNASNHLGDVPAEEPTEVNLLELMPTVEDKFSQVVYTKGAIVSSVIHNNPEEKLAFENKVITTLKSKLPEGAVVEAVLGEPYYKEGMKREEGKTNYTIHIRVSLKGKVYEQEYNVPHKEEFISVGVYHI